MIRLRCETGIRPRPAQLPSEHRSDGWFELALICARLQAKSFVGHGRRIVPCSELSVEARCDLPMLLYDAGIVELITWHETASGKINRIRRIDLSREAAQALVQAKVLPRCFVPVLVSGDLLEGWTDAVDHDEDRTLVDEFRAWLDCGGLGSGALQDWVGGELVLDIATIINRRRDSTEPKSFALMQDGGTTACNIR